MALSAQSLSHARMKVPISFGLLLLTLFARLTVAVSGTSGPFISGSESGRPSAEDLFVDVQAMADACPGEKEKMVMSLACYANPSSIAPFVRSWRMFSNETRILLMTNDERIHTALHRPPEVHVIMIKPIKDPKFLRAGKNLKKLPWWSWRMFGYVAFLEACAAKGALPHGIITADARDSMAMGDPWKHPLAERAIEENMTIFSYENQVYENGEPGVLLNKNEPWDKRMLINCFKSMQPYKVMDHLLNSPLTCAGAQIGSGQAMLAYHEVLLELALRNSSRMCMLIADQGLHNFMLHVMGRLWNTLPFKWEAYANGLSWLYTASVAMPIQINEDTGVISVHRKGWDHYPLYVHKFDRNATLYETVKHLYKLEGLDSQ